MKATISTTFEDLDFRGNECMVYDYTKLINIYIIIYSILMRLVLCCVYVC